MTEEQTQKFVSKWNELNGFQDGVVPEANMRYVEPGVVTWNEYDTPTLDLNQVKLIFSIV